jgi:hypothetical protein
VLVVFGPKERGWCEVGLGQGKRGRGGAVHGPNQGRKREGEVSPLLSLSHFQRERKKRGHAIVHVPKFVEKCMRTCVGENREKGGVVVMLMV